MTRFILIAAVLFGALVACAPQSQETVETYNFSPADRAAIAYCNYQSNLANDTAPGGIIAQGFASVSVRNSCLHYYSDTGMLPNGVRP